MLVCLDEVSQASKQGNLGEASDDLLTASNNIPTEAFAPGKELLPGPMLCYSTLLQE